MSLRSPLRGPILPAFGRAGLSAPAAGPLSVVAQTPVRQGTAALSNTQRWYITPPTPGNTLIAWFKPSPSGEVLVTSFVDSLGNNWTADISDGDTWVFRLNIAPNSPQYIDCVTDGIGLASCRLYCLEIGGAPGGLELVAGSFAKASYADQTSRVHSFTAPVTECLGIGFVHTSPSRWPVADVGSTLSRLLEDGQSGSPGNPFPQQVSEHSVYGVFADAGANQLGSSWLDGNNTEGYSTGPCGGLTTRFLYRKP